MRFLANENVPLSVVKGLREDGHDTAWIREDAPGSPDDRVLDRAVREDRILLTFDKDFGELVFLRGAEGSRGVVLCRGPGASPEETASFVRAAIASRSDWAGHFSVVERGRIRMRALMKT